MTFKPRIIARKNEGCDNMFHEGDTSLTLYNMLAQLLTLGGNAHSQQRNYTTLFVTKNARGNSYLSGGEAYQSIVPVYVLNG